MTSARAPFLRVTLSQDVSYPDVYARTEWREAPVSRELVMFCASTPSSLFHGEEILGVVQTVDLEL